MRPPRFVTAASLFDGHDASINIIRRVLQDQGAEVIHLGHNRSAEEIIDTAIQEDADAIAVSSYQGGHNEFFKYMRDLLVEKDATWIKIFGGGGGVIIPEEISALHDYGIDRIYSPEDGRELGLVGMITDMLEKVGSINGSVERGNALPQRITRVELGEEFPSVEATVPVVGLTGTGGAGKSSLTDEILRRLLQDFPERRFGVVTVDPTKRRTGGALLGDRIRINSADNPRAYVRSLATRASGVEVPTAIQGALEQVLEEGFDLVILETSGIGQGDSRITELADLSVYVMTPEYGAATQLEKIDMIDFADIVVLNKFDRAGAQDAIRDVRKQYRRSRGIFDPDVSDDDLPVFGTVASHFNDSGVEKFYSFLLKKLSGEDADRWKIDMNRVSSEGSTRCSIIPADRTGYLQEIVKALHDYHDAAQESCRAAQDVESLQRSAELLRAENPDASQRMEEMAQTISGSLDPRVRTMLDEWPQLVAEYGADELVFKIRDQEIRQPLHIETLSGTRLPRIALPDFVGQGDLARWLMLENLPGRFPFTAGVFPFRRQDERPKRMFAGEGPPEKTNARFHYLCQTEQSHRLSTAFDSVTLYGDDPDMRPDIYGKVGESGVSICCLDDMKKLYEGFDLCSPSTSVSMTINGPAPIILAMYFNTAIDQQVENYRAEKGSDPDSEELDKIYRHVFENVRGTVQADILKEDQAQNTCIFGIDFALRMMGDIQQFFIEEKVRNYYSVSISGYHIAEAGANPITQLAFTLSNGFTYVEYYLSRGMSIDMFARNLSFFFSNGLDAEYSVLGRVARRIWAVAMRDLYDANERSQKLKYHIQTSGRSLHSMEIDFNDIRTTLQALMAYYDQCNSLHTNSYDEAITTPTEDSVRRAMAIQLIVAEEMGLARNDNPIQGAFVIDELTNLVEEAVLEEFLRLHDRGGVLGAMERQYQRSKIQDESLLYEHRKHTGEIPIIGVNTFLRPDDDSGESQEIELRRSTPEEKDQRLVDLQQFQQSHQADTETALAKLQQVALTDGNIFRELIDTVRVASLGQITRSLYEVGGRYRRSM
ncbi:MAG: fused isobutyryl-CoA mutase/GTPase IcmF [Planctomycetota bacterium]|nr:fused isobutyryl-CoA mutase/GTPase IcmF [Planctomycetota bacterium]